MWSPEPASPDVERAAVAQREPACAGAHGLHAGPRASHLQAAPRTNETICRSCELDGRPSRRLLEDVRNGGLIHRHAADLQLGTAVSFEDELRGSGDGHDGCADATIQAEAAILRYAAKEIILKLSLSISKRNAKDGALQAMQRPICRPSQTCSVKAHATPSCVNSNDIGFVLVLKQKQTQNQNKPYIIACRKNLQNIDSKAPAPAKTMRVEVRRSIITETVRDESQAIPQGRHR